MIDDAHVYHKTPVTYLINSSFAPNIAKKPLRTGFGVSNDFDEVFSSGVFRT